MVDERIVQQHHATFEGIRHLDADGNEFWLARQLASVLDYSQYRHFVPVIERAKEACSNSGQPVADHIEDVLTMVDIGSGAKRQVEDFRLSRYACYLIVQNGDPGKPLIANGQTYFAMQTRRPPSTVRPELVEGLALAMHGNSPFLVSLSNHSPCTGAALRQAQGERNAAHHGRSWA